ncbi:Protein of unknown function [Prevotellaceae bacterium MN60]|nr:Protein of unknown function [Prevotellaceae bacterium MN60]
MRKILRLIELASNVEPKNVGRIDYFSFFLLYLLSHGLFAIVFYLILSISSVSYIGIPLAFAGGVFFTFSFVSFILLSLITKKRFADAGYSAWNFLWLIIPVVGFAVLLFIVSQPSVYIPTENDKTSGKSVRQTDE